MRQSLIITALSILLLSNSFGNSNARSDAPLHGDRVIKILKLIDGSEDRNQKSLLALLKKAAWVGIASCDFETATYDVEKIELIHLRPSDNLAIEKELKKAKDFDTKTLEYLIYETVSLECSVKLGELHRTAKFSQDFFGDTNKIKFILFMFTEKSNDDRDVPFRVFSVMAPIKNGQFYFAESKPIPLKTLQTLSAKERE